MSLYLSQNCFLIPTEMQGVKRKAYRFKDEVLLYVCTLYNVLVGLYTVQYIVSELVLNFLQSFVNKCKTRSRTIGLVYNNISYDISWHYPFLNINYLLSFFIYNLLWQPSELDITRDFLVHLFYYSWWHLYEQIKTVS